jgi:protein TonB
MNALASTRWPGAMIAGAIHLAVLAALWNYQPAREALAEALPIMVSFIAPDTREPSRPKPQQVAQPKPVQRSLDLPPAPLVMAPAEAPAPYLAPPEPPRPAEAATVATAPSPIVVALPPPVVSPRFDAAYLDNAAPSYPALSRRMREQGRVVLRVLVTPAGSAERVELRASSGSTRLDGAALETVKRWRFVPARQGAEAVSAWVLVPISFVLEG